MTHASPKWQAHPTCSHVFKRTGSDNWWIRLRSPTKATEKSLGTSDARQAEAAALPMIGAHKAALLLAKPHVETTFEREFEPGLHTGLNGERIYATDRELHYLDESPVRIEPNGFAARRIVGARQSATAEFNMFDAAYAERPVMPKRKTAGDDDDLLDTYIAQARKGRGLADHQAKEARDTLALFKRLTNGMAIKDATRADGRLVEKHLKGLKLKSATIQKRMGWLVAMCRFAIDEGNLTLNPFSGVAKQGDDAERRLPLSDDDMVLVKANMHRLDERNQLLLRFLAYTGARPKEALSIKEEMIESGVRYVMLGSKTEQSLRRVPLPSDFPAIKGPFFADVGTSLAVSKRFGVFLRTRCGITDPRKVAYSLRHRMKDRLRAVGCPLDVQYELLGHETKTIAAGYGRGYPVPVLKEWLDKAGGF
jgi:integrase